NATPDTVTYTLDLADTVLGWTAGDNIRVDQISQYLTDKGNDAQSVTTVVDGTGAQTGEIQVVRLASGSNISSTDWDAFNGPASVTVFGQNSVGEPPAGPVVAQSDVQGTHFGDGSVANGAHSAAFGIDSLADGDSASALGNGAQALGDDTLAIGRYVSLFGVPTAIADGAGAVAVNAQVHGAFTTGVGTGATINSGSDSGSLLGAKSSIGANSPRSNGVGASVSIPASTPDVGLWKNNSLEVTPSRTVSNVLQTNDPTVLKLHASDGTVHTLGVNTGTGVLTIDGVPLLTSIGTGYITSAMILDGTISLADLSSAVTANFATASALSTEIANRATSEALLVPRTAIPSGQYYSNANNGCYGKISTLACTANNGYFVPIELDYSSGSLTNISFNVSATGTAANAKWAIYARSSSGNATGAPLATGTIALSGTGLKVGSISPAIALGAGLPNEYNLAVVFDGTVTLTALDVTSGGRNMYRSGNMLLNVTAGRTTGVTYSTGFATTPTYSYTDQQVVPLMSLKTA